MKSSILSLVPIIMFFSVFEVSATSDASFGDPLVYLSSNQERNKQYEKQWLLYLHKFIQLSGLHFSNPQVSNLILLLKRLESSLQIKYFIKVYHVDLMVVDGRKFHQQNVMHVLSRFVTIWDISNGNITYQFNNAHRVWNFTPRRDFRIRMIIHRLKIHTFFKSCVRNLTINYKNVTDVLCGHYSDFYYYPTVSNVCLDIFYEINPLFKLNITFDLMTINVIQKFKLSRWDPKFMHIFYRIEIIQTEMYIYFLKVAKFKIMKLFLLEHAVLFDGPGYISLRKIIAKNTIYTTKGFQCIMIFILPLYSSIKEWNTFLVKYSDIKATGTKALLQKTHSSRQIVYDSLRNGNPYYSMFKSPNNTHLTAVISKFSFNASLDDLYCNNGGIAIFDLITGDPEETSFCYTRIDHQVNMQSFYSLSNTIRIVIFAYENYSNLSTTITVSFIACKVVKVNFCAEIYMCYSDPKLCKFVGEDAFTKLKRMKNKPRAATLMIHKEPCIIFQMQNNPHFEPKNFQHDYIYFCKSNIYIQNLNTPTTPVVYRYNISGYFISTIDDDRYQLFAMYGLPFKYDHTQDVSIYSWLNGNRKRIMGTGYNKAKKLMMEIAPLDRNVAFEATLLDIFPKYGDSPYFVIGLKEYKSWVAFHIERITLKRELSIGEKIVLNNSWQNVERLMDNKVPHIKIIDFQGNRHRSRMLLHLLVEMKVCRSMKLFLKIIFQI